MIERPADEVWGVIGDFGSPDWMPGVESWRLEGRDRRVVVVGGAELLEKCIRHDDDARTMSYGLVTGVAGVRHHEATITVTALGDRSVVTWSVVTDAAAVEPMRRSYQSMLEALKERLGASA